MADRFPLILNTSTNQIQEIPSGDNLDLTGVGINNVGVITSGNVQIGGGTTDLVVTGDARITGILTVGTDSITLNETANTINVGTALTLGHTQGLQFHTQNLHSAGFEVNQINSSGVVTATTFKGDGDFVELDVDGHTNLDNVSIAGVTTMSGVLYANGNRIYVNGADPAVDLIDSNNNSDYRLHNDDGTFKIKDLSNSNAVRYQLGADGKHYIYGDTAVMGSSNLTVGGNLSVGGVLTYEDVTNVDSVGLVTARDGVFIPDNKELKIGNSAASPDLKIYHDTSDSVIHQDGTGDLRIRSDNSIEFNTNGTQNAIWCDSGAAVKLYYNNGLKLATTNTGVQITGALNVTTTMHIPDGSVGLQIGSSNDLRIYHDGNNSAINDTGTGSLYIQGSNNIYLRDYDTAENHIVMTKDGSVDLYHDGSKKFFTITNGVQATNRIIVGEGTAQRGLISGDANSVSVGSISDIPLNFNRNSQIKARIDGNDFQIPNDNGKIELGASQDLSIYHNGSDSLIANTTGVFFIQNTGDLRIRVDNTDAAIHCVRNGTVELYHDGTKKFETTSSGATVTGALSVTGDITVPTSMDSTNAGGVGIQRFWTASIAAGNVYKCGQWYAGEGAVQLLIAVRSYTPGHSGTTTYMYQGGFSAIGASGIARLYPLTVGTGHGNGPDNGTNSNAWELLIDNINNYTYAVYVHVPSGVHGKNLRVTVTELGRGYNFTDLSSTVAYSSLTVQSSPILSSNVNHFGHTYLRDNYTINLGNSNDLKLFHDGSHSYIHDNGTGNLRIRGEDVEITDHANNNNMARFIEQGGVELYYNNSKHFEVTSFGAETVYSSGGGNTPIFKVLHGNRSQGVGLGYHSVNAIGTNPNIELRIVPKGTSAVYIQRDNGADMLRANPGAELILYHNGEETAQTYNTNGRKAFLVGDKSYINSGISHGELIVRKNLSSPNNASIEQCARMTVITNEQTAGGNGYGGAVFFGAQDVSTSNQYTYRLGAIGAKIHNSADLANTTPNGDLSFFCQNSSLYERGRLRHDGYLFLTNTSIQSLSDIRLKENIEDYSFDLDKFKQFKPVTFNWKKPEYHSETPKSGKHRGFIAQDVQKLDSYALVNEYDLDKDSEERELIDEDGIGLTSTLGDKDAMYVSVIQQMIDKIEKLEKEVAALKGS